MEHDAADHQRPVAVDLPGVGLGARAVDDGDRAAPDDLHDVVRADDAGRVLVDAEPEQARVLGDQAEQPAEPVPLLEVLVDDDPGQDAEPGRDLGHPVLRASRPDAPNAIMWLDIADAPADVPATTAPCWNRSRMASARRVPPIVDDSRSWLPPVRKTPVASRTASAAVSSLACGRVTAWSGRTRLTPSSPKTGPIALAGLEAERRRRADDRDRRVLATRRARRSGSG